MPLNGYSVIVHRGKETAQVITSFLRSLSQQQRDWRVAASVWLPRNRVTHHQQVLDEFQPSTRYVLADPETPKVQLQFDRRGHGRKDFAYLQESDPAANRERFVRQVLEAQLSVGAQVLIAPWLVHGRSGTDRELNATIDFATRAASSPLASNRTLLLSVAATDGVFADVRARNNLLNLLVELPERPIYLRMEMSSAPAGRAQYQGRAALSGLRECIEALASNDRPVFLPQTGVLGWLMLPFGATAFGTGLSASMQRNLPLPTEGGGGGGLPPLHWYFLPQFLGFVLAEELDSLRRVTGFEECSCPSCARVRPRGGAAFNEQAAGHHFLWWCARLANELNEPGGSAVATVRERLEAASAFWRRVQRAGVVLDDRSQPMHLATWTQVAA